MSVGTGSAEGATRAFESLGVRVRVTCDRPETADRIDEVLPPNFVEIPLDAEAEDFGLIADGAGAYTFTRGGSPVSTDVDLEFGIMMLQTQTRLFVALNANERIFVHAGAVAVGGRAVIFPGRSFSGKTTLVAEFLRAGAMYLSDEFAVLDHGARIHPYPTKLSVREGPADRREVSASELGGVPAASSLPLGAIVITNHRPGATWAPDTITRGQAVLAMLDNTVAAVFRHSEALNVFRQATAGPLLLSGERGEAEPVVADLMARLS